MEVDEGPTNPTDLVEEMSPVMSTPPRSGEPAPIGTSSPITVPGDDGIDPSEGSRRDNLQGMEADSDEAEERFSLAEEVLEPREMGATPAEARLPPELKPDMEEKASVAEYTAPTPEGCVTTTGLLSATGSLSRPRASPKRKQPSSPEGSEIAAEWVSTVKRHCGSVSEHAPSSRLPGRMLYGASSLDQKEGPGAVEEGGDRAPILQEDEGPAVPPMTPGNTSDPPESNPGEESEDLLFAMPPEGDKPLRT